MRRGMKESADESDFECFKRPRPVNTPDFVVRDPQMGGRTENDFAAVKYANDFVSRRPVGLDL
jgi:hypothetical protein